MDKYYFYTQQGKVIIRSLNGIELHPTNHFNALPGSVVVGHPSYLTNFNLYGTLTISTATIKLNKFTIDGSKLTKPFTLTLPSNIKSNMYLIINDNGELDFVPPPNLKYLEDQIKTLTSTVNNLITIIQNINNPQVRKDYI